MHSTLEPFSLMANLRSVPVNPGELSHCSKSFPVQNDLEYIDDNAEKLGRQKMRSDAMKRQFAINGLCPVHIEWISH